MIFKSKFGGSKNNESVDPKTLLVVPKQKSDPYAANPLIDQPLMSASDKLSYSVLKQLQEKGTLLPDLNDAIAHDYQDLLEEFQVRRKQSVTDQLEDFKLDDSFEDLGKELCSPTLVKKATSDFEQISDAEVAAVPDAVYANGVNFADLMTSHRFDFRKDK